MVEVQYWKNVLTKWHNNMRNEEKDSESWASYITKNAGTIVKELTEERCTWYTTQCGKKEDWQTNNLAEHLPNHWSAKQRNGRVEWSSRFVSDWKGDAEMQRFAERLPYNIREKGTTMIDHALLMAWVLHGDMLLSSVGLATLIVEDWIHQLVQNNKYDRTKECSVAVSHTSLLDDKILWDKFGEPNEAQGDRSLDYETAPFAWKAHRWIQTPTVDMKNIFVDAYTPWQDVLLAIERGTASGIPWQVNHAYHSDDTQCTIPITAVIADNGPNKAFRYRVRNDVDHKEARKVIQLGVDGRLQAVLTKDTLTAVYCTTANRWICGDMVQHPIRHTLPPALRNYPYVQLVTTDWINVRHCEDTPELRVLHAGKIYPVRWQT